MKNLNRLSDFFLAQSIEYVAGYRLISVFEMKLCGLKRLFHLITQVIFKDKAFILLFCLAQGFTYLPAFAHPDEKKHQAVRK